MNDSTFKNLPSAKVVDAPKKESGASEVVQALQQESVEIRRAISSASSSISSAVADAAGKFPKPIVQPPRAYEFIVKRNKEGFIESVIARPATLLGGTQE